MRLIKLVRDKFTTFKARELDYHTMTDAAYEMQLRRKIVEEATEWALEPNKVDELADLYEVIRAAAWYFHELNMGDIGRMANEKAEKYGGFWEGMGMYGHGGQQYG